MCTCDPKALELKDKYKRMFPAFEKRKAEMNDLVNLAIKQQAEIKALKEKQANHARSYYPASIKKSIREQIYDNYHPLLACGRKDDANEYLKRAADQGHTDACFYMGLNLDNGTILGDYEANKYYEKAARENHPEALCNMGIIYANKESFGYNTCGYQMLFKSACLGNKTALANLKAIGYL